jgi:hypothetical protein
VSDQLDVEPIAIVAYRTCTIVLGRRPVAAVTEWVRPGRLAAASPEGGEQRRVV